MVDLSGIRQYWQEEMDGDGEYIGDGKECFCCGEFATDGLLYTDGDFVCSDCGSDGRILMLERRVRRLQKQLTEYIRAL